MPAVAEQAEFEATTFEADGVITVSSAHSVHDTFSAFLSPLLPVLIENLSMTRTAAGLLTVFYQAPSLAQPIIGHLGDRFDLRILVILAPTLSAAAFTMLGIVPVYGLLALMLFLAGINSAGLHAIGPVLAGQFSGRRLGRGMSYWMVGGELGRTLGPLIVVAAVALLTPKGLPILMPAGAVASLLIWWQLRQKPRVRPGEAKALPWKHALAQMSPILAPLAFVIATRSLLAMAMSTFLPTFLTEQGEGLWLAGASLSIMEAAGVMGALFGGSLSDRLGRRQVLLVMTVLAPLAAWLFLNTTGWLRLIVLLGLGFSLLSTTPVIMALVQERVKGGRALANGIYMALNFAITSLAVVIVGLLGDRFGLASAYQVSMLLMLLGAPFVLWLTRGSKETL